LRQLILSIAVVYWEINNSTWC